MKTSRKILAVVLALCLVFSLSSFAFADNTVTVYVKIQTASVPTGNPYNYTLGTLTNVNVLSGTDNNGFVEVEVTKAGTIYVKDVVNAMSGVTVVSDCSACGTCTHDSYGCTCTNSGCVCTWKKVTNYSWNGTAYVADGYASMLNSLNYNGVTRTNVAQYVDNYDDDDNYVSTTYTGNSWEYFTSSSATGTNVYSNSLYMDQMTVTNGMYITLSYDFSTFTY